MWPSKSLGLLDRQIDTWDQCTAEKLQLHHINLHFLQTDFCNGKMKKILYMARILFWGSEDAKCLISNSSANTLINSISITTVHTVMKLAVDIQHPNRMIHNDFVDTLRCCLKGLHCPSANLCFNNQCTHTSTSCPLFLEGVVIASPHSSVSSWQMYSKHMRSWRKQTFTETAYLDCKAHGLPFTCLLIIFFKYLLSSQCPVCFRIWCKRKWQGQGTTE